MKKQKNFKRVIILAVVAVMMLTFAACGGGSSSNSGSSDDYVYVPTVSPYVTMIKDATHSSYGITYGRAFDAFFASPKWSYFKATTGEHVVEFEGKFTYDGSPATATIQFVLDMSEGTFSAYHLSINGADQSKIMLAALIKKVFESY